MILNKILKYLLIVFLSIAGLASAGVAAATFIPSLAVAPVCKLIIKKTLSLLIIYYNLLIDLSYTQQH